jgi:hypothetical protein
MSPPPSVVADESIDLKALLVREPVAGAAG